MNELRRLEDAAAVSPYDMSCLVPLLEYMCKFSRVDMLANNYDAYATDEADLDFSMSHNLKLSEASALPNGETNRLLNPGAISVTSRPLCQCESKAFFCLFEEQQDLFKIQPLNESQLQDRNKFFSKVIRSQWYRDGQCLWQKVCVAIYLAGFMHLITNLYCQYKYDAYLIILRKLIADQSVRTTKNVTTPSLSNSHPPISVVNINNDFIAQRHDIENQVNTWLGMLKIVGAPHRQEHFMVQCMYGYLMVFSFLVYICAPIYYEFVVPFDFKFMRSIKDYDNERSQCAKMVRVIIDKFIGSKRVMINEQFRLSSDCRFVDSEEMTLLHNVPSSNNKHLIKTKVSLLEMLANGSLIPIEQLDKTSRTYNINSFYYLTMALVNIAFALGAFVLIIYYADKTGLTLSAWLIIFELAFLVIIVSISGTLYVSAFIVSCIEQIKLATKTRRQVADCIDLLKHHYMFAESILNSGIVSTSVSQLSRIETLYENMDLSLLFIVLRYKTFVAQFSKPIKRSYGFLLGCVTLMLFAYPVISILHLSYIDREKTAHYRKYSFYLSFVLLWCVNCFHLTACVFYSRSIALYKSLNELLALVVDISTQTFTANGPQNQQQRPSLDEHTVLALRRELSHPDFVKNQFATRSFGMRYHFGSLIKIYFYYGIVLFALLVDVRKSSTGTLSSALFADPFGILD